MKVKIQNSIVFVHVRVPTYSIWYTCIHLLLQFEYHKHHTSKLNSKQVPCNFFHLIKLKVLILYQKILLFRLMYRNSLNISSCESRYTIKGANFETVVDIFVPGILSDFPIVTSALFPMLKSQLDIVWVRR